MFGALKKGAIDFTLKTKSLFSSSGDKSKVYVRDLRKVMTYDGRRCKYPKNYDQVVKSGEIIKDENSKGETIYKLLHGKKDKDGRWPSFELTEIDKVDNRSYFTIKFLVDPDERESRSDDLLDYSTYYKPFGFSRSDLEKHIPVFEVDLASLKLTNSSVLTKGVKSKEGKAQEVNEKGRNGELLYTSDYKKLNTSFSEIRDQNGNLELDKSLISVPIVFAAGLAKICAKLLTFIPMKLGEHLINTQNPIAKFFGYLLFTPAMAVKNLVNMGAPVFKAPILLFVADKKKYGDAYWTMWKHQLKGCWEEVKSDFNVIKDGERLKPEQKDHKPLSIVGTWDELDARRPDIEKDLEKALNKGSKSIDKSLGTEKSLGKPRLIEENLQNKENKKRAKSRKEEKLSNHTDKVTQERQEGANTTSRPL